MLRTNNDQVHADVVADDDTSEMRVQASRKLVPKRLWWHAVGTDARSQPTQAGLH